MFFGYVLPFLVVFTILVFVHELGHYLVAKRFGVTIETFSIGFGPEIFGWTDKSGTRWKFSIIPFGGYVKYLGDADASSRPDNCEMEKLTDEQKSKTMHAKTPCQRIWIAAAGPIANYILAIVTFFFLFATVGQRYVPAKISDFVEGSSAKEAGLQVGDMIKSINGEKIKTFLDIERFVKTSANVPLNMIVDREGKELSLTVAPKEEEEKSKEGETKKVGRLGIIRSLTPEYIQHSVGSALYTSVQETLSFSWSMLVNIGQMFTGKRSADEMGGFLRIAEVTGQASQMGMATLVWMMASLSVNLGLFNLFPVPVLDGGHILFYTIEAIRGKPLSEKIQERAFMTGLILILGLMIYINGNDFVHFKVFAWVKSLFS